MNGEVDAHFFDEIFPGGVVTEKRIESAGVRIIELTRTGDTQADDRTPRRVMETTTPASDCIWYDAEMVLEITAHVGWLLRCRARATFGLPTHLLYFFAASTAHVMSVKDMQASLSPVTPADVNARATK